MNAEWIVGGFFDVLELVCIVRYGKELRVRFVVTAGSGATVLDDKNPFDVDFPDHAGPAGEAAVSSEGGSKSETVDSGAAVSPAQFVHELVPAEGHMINPITGEACTSCLASHVGMC